MSRRRLSDPSFAFLLNAPALLAIVGLVGYPMYPILKGFKTNVDGLDEFWSMVFASGGNLFDEELNPVFPDKDKTGLAVLEWMVQAMHDWKILDPKGLELDETQARAAFVNGQGFFTSNVGHVLAPRQQPEAQQAGRRHQPGPLPGTHRHRQRADGLDPALEAFHDASCRSPSTEPVKENEAVLAR